MSQLPINNILPQLLATLDNQPNVVLQASPGAGKTTRVPLALLEQSWLTGKIIMLEPRRLAARNAAEYMAELLSEKAGQSIGYRTRLDSKVSAVTRVEVVTEGILTRIIQSDPELSGYQLVIFDEFHERNLQGDLGLALCLEAQQALRDDLKILVMSATLDALPVAGLLGDAPVIVSEGRCYPVEIRYGQKPEPRRLIDTLCQTVVTAHNSEPGDILVFLPGVGEIRKLQQRLDESGLPASTQVLPLFGDLSHAQQERAIRPSPNGQRKIVLSTSIAETSLTIEGVRVVVDAGLMRSPRFDPRSGMTRLETLAVTQASAEQRSGRAGRLAPGVCYRLWSSDDHKRLLAHGKPEIMEADLAPLALELAQWGVSDPAQLSWLDCPPAAAFTQARDLLHRLGALDEKGQITPHGQQVAQLSMHPRLAHMVLKGKALGLGSLACEVAALLEERDILRGSDRNADLRLRLEQLHQANHPQLDRGACQRIKQSVQRWRRQLQIDDERDALDQLGLLLAFAYPDRIAQRRRGNDTRYLLSGGSGALFREMESLATSPYLVIAQLDGRQKEAHIFLAAAITLAELAQHHGEQIKETTFIGWDNKSESVQAHKQRRLGTLVLEEQALKSVPKEQIAQGLLDGIRQKGLCTLPWNKELEQWRTRIMLLRNNDVASGDDKPWPDVSDEALLQNLEQWLLPYLTGMSRLSHLQQLKLADIFNAMLSWPQQQALNEQAPTHVQVPSGSRIRIDYDQPSPVLAVRLQELFGMHDTPRIAAGKIALTIHLLSPAQRPIQVTQDLASFWANTYQEVKKDLKGRYPKHYWPDDPYQAEATRRVRPNR